MTPLVWWGTPSRRNDALLFGPDGAWPAERFHADQAAQELRQRKIGADTDLNPLANRSEITDLSATDAARAEILRRYRLFTHQPDEMNTFRALARMNPRKLDFDPRMYQYGGLYFWVVGGTLAIASRQGRVQLSGDLNVYLANPELFAEVYAVSRLASLAFAAAALVATYQLAARAAGRRAGWIAFVLLASAPVFISGALEAKPHLPAATMILWATRFALDFLDRASRRDALLLGACAGASCSLVLTGFAVFLLWPAAYLVAGRQPHRAIRSGLALALLTAIGIFVVTNPYVPWNLLFDRAALFGNLSNSTKMYSISNLDRGALRVLELFVESIGPITLAGGAIGTLLLYRRFAGATGIAASTSAGMLVLCVAIGADKPAEYARFLVGPAMFAIVAAAAFWARLARKSRIALIAGVLAAVAIARPDVYLRSFALDSAGKDDTRVRAARELAALDATGPVGVFQEPAPFSIPPLDFAHRTILWLPETPPAILDPALLPAYAISTEDDPQRSPPRAKWRRYYEPIWSTAPEADRPSRITWANKVVVIFRRCSPSP